MFIMHLIILFKVLIGELLKCIRHVCTCNATLIQQLYLIQNLDSAKQKLTVFYTFTKSIYLQRTMIARETFAGIWFVL